MASVCLLLQVVLDCQPLPVLTQCYEKGPELAMVHLVRACEGGVGWGRVGWGGVGWGGVVWGGASFA